MRASGCTKAWASGRSASTATSVTRPARGTTSAGGSCRSATRRMSRRSRGSGSALLRDRWRGRDVLVVAEQVVRVPLALQLAEPRELLRAEAGLHATQALVADEVQ